MRLIYYILILILLSFSITIYAGPEFGLIYVIQEGDTLSEIAADYGIPTRELLALNNLNWNSMIRVGQELLIPKKEKKVKGPEWNYRLMEQKINNGDFKLDVGEVYSVRVNPDQKLPDVSHIPKDKIITYHVGVGDTLYDLARSFNTSIGVIMALNNKSNSIIRVGDSLKLPIHNLTPRQVLAKTITDEDLELLARVIHGEARGEPFIGQVAVGAVVINRVLDPFFPNTIREVIYQKNQFSCVNDGQINLKPNSTSYRAAREALNGTDPTMGSLYFYNPRTANYQWWFETRRRMVTIGNHVFTL
ncbi:MAG TPA: LysM peptidoglycan-binding domain-containing protein [Halanaerobiaceae bacterium]|jgi:N-acetylmuramoyl-L-alanine amidase|nr:LysM peptidoglycan-binding domain-containing protein [Halanaerobiaceae bacterium]HOA40435.1 cell wall hydrolase [Halanaerobiales bacterium]HPZ62581.1 cell wall hydrolase [Halanaerobiales bacterium]HQD03123.1 cell wall hydrolase [Halanaerobiales bacterium]